MAIAVIGGLITSTFLSLLVIPAVFTYVDDFSQWMLRLFRRSKRTTEAAHSNATMPLVAATDVGPKHPTD
jgi:predicted RND superfamily exporter protein